jgi:predicted DsbA family dithiol-disulfide isomerase
MYTDPWCPYSWGSEPHRRRLEVEFGESVSITYVMGGMQEVLSKPVSFAEEWLEAAEESGMPADPRQLLTDPPSSTHPAGIAVRAVSEQVNPGAFLRRVRESIFLWRRRMDRIEHFIDLARDLRLDIDRLRIDLGSHAILEAFGADLERAQAAGPEGGRVKLPTLEVAGELVTDPARWRDAVAAAGAQPTGTWPLGAEECVRRFGLVTLAEVAVLCDLPGPRAGAALWRAAEEWKLRPRRVLFGEVWEVA